VVDSSRGTAGGQPPVEPAKMKGLLKGLRYISQIFGKHIEDYIIMLFFQKVIPNATQK
jgi:hypothetical protein